MLKSKQKIDIMVSKVNITSLILIQLILKITGSVGKGSGRTDVTNPFGKDTFQGEGPLDKEIRFKLTKKFSKGGTVKDYIKDLL
jgi:hypothetical protein